MTARFQVPLREDGDKRRRGRAEKRHGERRPGVAIGPLHPRHRWRQLEESLTSSFGGWTFEAEVEGEWFDVEQGVAVRERSRVYSVDVPDERVDELIVFLRRVCKTFVQKCIRVVIDGRARYVREEDHDEPL